MEEENQSFQNPEIIKQNERNHKLNLELKIPPLGEVEVLCNFVDEGGEVIAIQSIHIDGEAYQSRCKKKDTRGWVYKLAFGLALIIYLLIRLVDLEDFPIYFFSDEAIQTVHAADLIRDQFVGPYNDFLPTFFDNGGQFNLSTSVYYQVLPTLLFGKAIWVTRGSAAILTLLAALGVGLIIEMSLKKGFGWLAVLVLSLMPAWFLHSRTAFETSMAVSFYTGFVCCYVLYRYKNPRYLYLAALMAGLAFYSYSPMRVVIGFTLLGFLLSDVKYHWQQKNTFLKAIGLGLLLLFPYLRFSLDHPGESVHHLEILGSYWVQNISFLEKLGHFVVEYARGLNPFYWYLQNNVDLQRHIMKNYGHLWQAGFPFLLVGIYWCVRHIKQPLARMMLIMVLAAPSGAAIVGLGITRTLVMVIPASLLTTIGMVQVWDWIKQKICRTKNLFNGYGTVLFLCTFTALGLLNVRMLVDAIRNSPTWFTNYGLYGMQYGARQVFGTIKSELQEYPQKKFYLTSAWTNGADVLARFFFDDPLPFEMGSIDGFINDYRQFDPDTVFVMIPEEMKSMQESQKFTNVKTQKVIDYPDGEPGFYFTTLEYVPDIENVFSDELAARRYLNSETLLLTDGREVEVDYSTLDMGEIKHVFDGDSSTLARTWESNPFRIIVHFSEPMPMEQLILKIGGEATRIEADIWQADAMEPIQLTHEVPESADPRFTKLDLPSLTDVAWLEIRVKNLNNSEPAHVHLWEIQFSP